MAETGELNLNVNIKQNTEDIRQMQSHLDMMTSSGAFSNAQSARDQGRKDKLESSLSRIKEINAKWQKEGSLTGPELTTLNNLIKEFYDTLFKVRTSFKPLTADAKKLSIELQKAQENLADLNKKQAAALGEQSSLSKKITSAVSPDTNTRLINRTNNRTFSLQKLLENPSEYKLGQDFRLAQTENGKVKIDDAGHAILASKESQERLASLLQAYTEEQKNVQDLTAQIQDVNAKLSDLIAQLDKASVNANGNLSNGNTINQEIANANNDLATATQNIQESRQANYNKEAQKDLKDYNDALKNVDTTQRKNNSTLAKTFRSLSIYALALRTVKAALREAISTITELDKSLTEQAMVTGMTREQAYKNLQVYQQIAVELGATTKEVSESISEFLKQGKTLEEAETLTRAAVSAAKVARVSIGDSINYLTTALNGFSLSAEQAMAVSDKFAALAAASATDYDELATALSKVASQANLAGMSINYTTALLTTGLEVTREAPETMGTALKTVIARMREISDYGKVLEDGTAANNVETQLEYIGIALRDSNGELRSTEDVLDELGRKWNTLSSNQQAAIAKALAGTRQQARLIAMMDNYDRVLELEQISLESTGATSAQASTYLKGMEAAVNQVKTAWEAVVTSITKSQAIIDIISTAGKWINSFAKEIQKNNLAIKALFAIMITGLSNYIVKKADAAVRNRILIKQQEAARAEEAKNHLKEIQDTKAALQNTLNAKQEEIKKTEEQLKAQQNILDKAKQTTEQEKQTLETLKQQRDLRQATANTLQENKDNLKKAIKKTEQFREKAWNESDLGQYEANKKAELNKAANVTDKDWSSLTYKELDKELTNWKTLKFHNEGQSTEGIEKTIKALEKYIALRKEADDLDATKKDYIKTGKVSLTEGQTESLSGKNINGPQATEEIQKAIEAENKYKAAIQEATAAKTAQEDIEKKIKSQQDKVTDAAKDQESVENDIVDTKKEQEKQTKELTQAQLELNRQNEEEATLKLALNDALKSEKEAAINLGTSLAGTVAIFASLASGNEKLTATFAGLQVMVQGTSAAFKVLNAVTDFYNAHKKVSNALTEAGTVATAKATVAERVHGAAVEKQGLKAKVAALFNSANSSAKIPWVGWVIALSILALAGVAGVKQIIDAHKNAEQEAKEKSKEEENEIYTNNKRNTELKKLIDNYTEYDKKLIKTADDYDKRTSILKNASDSLSEDDRAIYNKLEGDNAKLIFLQNKIKENNAQIKKDRESILNNIRKTPSLISYNDQDTLAQLVSINNSDLADSISKITSLTSAESLAIEKVGQNILDVNDAATALQMKTDGTADQIAKALAKATVAIENTAGAFEQVNAAEVLTSQTSYALRQQLEAYQEIRAQLTGDALKSFNQQYSQYQTILSLGDATISMIDDLGYSVDELNDLYTGFDQISNKFKDKAGDLLMTEDQYQQGILDFFNAFSSSGNIRNSIEQVFGGILSQFSEGSDEWNAAYNGLVNLITKATSVGIQSIGQNMDSFTSTIENFYSKASKWSTMSETDKTNFLSENSAMFTGKDGAALLQAFRTNDYDAIEAALRNNGALEKQRQQRLKEVQQELDAQLALTEDAQDKGRISYLQSVKETLEDVDNLWKVSLETRLEQEQNALNQYKNYLEEQKSTQTDALNDRKDAYQKYFEAVNQEAEDEDFEKQESTLINNLSKLGSSTDATSNTQRADLEQKLQELEDERIKTLRERAQDAVITNIEDTISAISDKFDKLLDTNRARLSAMTADLNNPSSMLAGMISQNISDGSTALEAQSFLASLQSIYGASLNGVDLSKLQVRQDSNTGNLSLVVNGTTYNLNTNDQQSLYQTIMQALRQLGIK